MIYFEYRITFYTYTCIQHYFSLKRRVIIYNTCCHEQCYKLSQRSSNSFKNCSIGSLWLSSLSKQDSVKLFGCGFCTSCLSTTLRLLVSVFMCWTCLVHLCPLRRSFNSLISSSKFWILFSRSLLLFSYLSTFCNKSKQQYFQFPAKRNVSSIWHIFLK